MCSLDFVGVSITMSDISVTTFHHSFTVKACCGFVFGRALQFYVDLYMWCNENYDPIKWVILRIIYVSLHFIQCNVMSQIHQESKLASLWCVSKY